MVDYGAAKDHVAGVIATIEPHDSVERFEGLGVQVIREYGRFISPTEVQAGDTVTEGQPLMLIEAMKTFNQIRAPRAGKVTRIPIKSGQPVEFGEILMLLE